MILADDEPVIIKGIQKLVDFSRLGIEIVGEYEDGKAAFDGILTEKPDIALLDIYMPKKTGIEILKELKALGIETKVIFVSGFRISSMQGCFDIRRCELSAEAGDSGRTGGDAGEMHYHAETGTGWRGQRWGEPGGS